MEFGNLVTIKGKGCRINKGIKTKMKTHKSKTYFLSTYHLVATIVL